MTDVLDELRAADPLRDRIIDPLPAPRLPVSGPRRRPGVVAVAGVAIVAVVAAGLAVLPQRKDHEALAARTYAQLDSHSNVLHFVLDTRYRQDGRVVAHLRLERWQSGQRQRTLTRSARQRPDQALETTVDGLTIRSYIPGRGGVRTTHAKTSRSSAVGTDPLSTYRRRYDAGQVHDAGAATLDGHAVHRLVVHAGPRTITYYVDQGDGTPVAIAVRQTPVVRTLSPTGKTTGVRHLDGPRLTRLTRVVRYERLPRTADNLGLLAMRGPSG